MPTPFSGRPPAKAIVKSADSLGFWALSMGLAAIGAASVAYTSNGDSTGAASILVAAAAMAGLMLYNAERR